MAWPGTLAEADFLRGSSSDHLQYMLIMMMVMVMFLRILRGSHKDEDKDERGTAHLIIKNIAINILVILILVCWPES